MIDREELIEQFTDEDVIQLMEQLGAIKKKGNSSDNEIIFSAICHHSNSYKLYYYKDSKMFVCYSSCGSMSLIDVVMSALDIPNDKEGFKEACNYLCNFKGIKSTRTKKVGFKRQEIIDEDLNILKLHRSIVRDKSIKNLPSYNENILKIFDDYFPIEWEEDGMSKESGQKYEIKVYFSQQQVIIPHRDINGNLVGVRCRNFNQQMVDRGMKYIPIEIEGLTYKYPMSYNLYGLYQNKENIKRLKKAIVAESEKSSIIADTFFGSENNVTVASCGMNFTKYQRDLLLSLGVSDLIIAYDKQYELDKLAYYTTVDVNTLTAEQKAERKKKIGEFNNYIKKLMKIYELVEGYMNMYIIACWDDRLDYKDSPYDKGKVIFDQLYDERHLVSDIEELERELIII